MIYGKALPRIDNIRWLRRLVGPFPTTSGEILEIARSWNFSRGTIDFLKLFPRDEEFTSEDDFLTRCEEVEMLMREEQKMPAEVLHSPQG
jgi:hypothetical protein